MSSRRELERAQRASETPEQREQRLSRRLERDRDRRAARNGFETAELKKEKPDNSWPPGSRNGGGSLSLNPLCNIALVERPKFIHILS